MRALIIDYLPWLLSAITVWMTLLAGNKSRFAWMVGLGNQLLWLAWIIASAQWGLLPLNIALWIVYGRNQLKWMAERDRAINSAHPSPLQVSEDIPLWKQIETLFERHGVDSPPWRLRDELVTHLTWARMAVRMENERLGR